MKPRVAIACRRVRGSTGTETTIFEHARRLCALGWEVHVYAEKLDSRRLKAYGARPHPVPGWPWGSHFKRRVFATLSDEPRMAEVALLRGHDVVSGVSVAILPRGRAYGVLAAYSDKPRRFQAAELEFLRAVARLL
ncbi:MAG: GAF domain-containing protein, partial [Elusimicrobiota bacterium]